ncbi:hypothetical protein ACHHV8_08960 [Paenibacillus sp. TAB 01]|uniref:hypothetical protein n=1 Tax=Paenibacillus sp. TAB 01 TaxID=3368988 RepID=UPI003752FD65
MLWGQKQQSGEAFLRQNKKSAEHPAAAAVLGTSDESCWGNKLNYQTTDSKSKLPLATIVTPPVLASTVGPL